MAQQQELHRSKVLELVRSKVLELARSMVLVLVRSKLVLERCKQPCELRIEREAWQTIRRHSSFQQLVGSTQLLVLGQVHSSCCAKPSAWQTDHHHTDQPLPTNRC
jgi:hypothetical protein